MNYDELGARTLLVAPGLTTSGQKLLGAKGIVTRSKDATSGGEGNRCFIRRQMVSDGRPLSCSPVSRLPHLQQVLS